jgi:hypothetical protein
MSHSTRSSLFQIFYCYRADRVPRRRGATAVAVRKGDPRNHVDPPPIVLIEDTEVCLPTPISEVLLAATWKSADHSWNGGDIIELLSSEHKSLVAGDPNDKYSFSNSVASKTYGANLLNLLNIFLRK